VTRRSRRRFSPPRGVVSIDKFRSIAARLCVLFFRKENALSENMHQRNLARANDAADDFSALLPARCG
jgi:hypothetical protein